ncbi:PiggyBac transposable element-derived protein 4 [Labeo rohita]|uniref:PiggyBac transposable element-derived protein 4 n=1 Tax=Labeo rohita TaxID=84645 RepID=A0ABQ8L582_LABRO|nr:PiggyBac transposable element-derived protein 4 [Labeo rohita]
MKAFLALHLCMGLVENAEIEDYWAEFWPTYTPGFGKVMSRNRFEIILSFLHFANNSEYVGRGQPGHDRLFKWSMYTGQNADADLGATHLIVHQLMAQHTGKGHEVYMDSYYTSPAIANELANNDTGMCGTVNCKRRGMPRYSTFMGEVDTADQRMKTYLFPHCSRRWYNRIFNAILSICVMNSHIIYPKCAPGPHKPLKAFIQDIITALLEGYSKRESKKPGRPSVEGGEMPQRLTERHWLCVADERPDCVVCSDRTRSKGRRQTKYRCSQCGVGLRAVPCNESCSFSAEGLRRTG